MNSITLVTALSVGLFAAGCTQQVESSEPMPPGAVGHASEALIITPYTICQSAESCADQDMNFDGCACQPKDDACTIVEDGVASDPQSSSATGTLYWGSNATWDANNFTYRFTAGSLYNWGQYPVSSAINSLGCKVISRGNAVTTKRLANGTYVRSHFGMRYNATTRTFASNVGESPYKTTSSTSMTYFTTRASGASTSYQYALYISF